VTRQRCPAVLARIALALAAVTLAAATPSPEPAAGSRADYDRDIAAAKAAMLGDPLRARNLGHAARDVALTWPRSAARDIAVTTAQWLEGEGAYRANDIAAAAPLIDAALAMTEKVARDSRLHADLLLSRARLQREAGAPQDALAAFQRAYNIYTSQHDARGQAKALQSIGSIYLDAQDYQRVLYYYGQADELAANDPTLRLSAKNNIATAYQNLARYREAATAFDESLRLAKKLQSPLLVARILANIGDNAIENHDYSGAEQAISAGLKLTARPAAASWRPMLLATRAKLELAEGRAPDALRDITSALANANTDGGDQLFGALQLTAYRVYKAAGDEPRALNHLEAYRAIDNKGRTLAASTNAALMTARFDFDNQNARITALKAARLRSEIAIARASARQSTVIFTGLLGVLVLVLVFLFVYLRSLRLNRAEIMVSNARLAETNVELGDALQAKSQFLATTSHEIRTPLNGILGMTQVMLADAGVDGILRDRVGVVDAAGRAMRTLVDDILDFAKIDSGAVRLDAASTDLTTLIPEIVSLWRVQAQAKGLDLRLSMTGVDAPMLTDAARLRQVVFNLLSNAIKFTPHGAVTVDVRAEDGLNGPTIAIAITDSGIGIPPSAFETIFEPFRQLDTSTTRQFGGTGLGLAISRHLARILGGDIAVASVPGTGATFTLRLPYAHAAARSTLLPSDQAVATSVLIAATNPIRRSFLCTAVGDIGRIAGCDIGGIAAFVGSCMVGVVLLDVGDDEGLRLVETVLATLAAVPGRPPLVLLVPATIGDDKASLLTAGAAAVVVKPVRATALSEVLTDIKDGSAGVAPRPVVFAADLP
jgi:signal transduction histidine kinase